MKSDRGELQDIKQIKVQSCDRRLDLRSVQFWVDRRAAGTEDAEMNPPGTVSNRLPEGAEDSHCGVAADPFDWKR